MKPFQWLAIALLTGLLAREFMVFWRGRQARGIVLLRTLLWLAAIIAFADPDLVQRLGNALGIENAPNLILCLLVLAFLGTSFFLYSRIVRMQRQLTQLVRHSALKEARPGPGVPGSEAQDEH